MCLNKRLIAMIGPFTLVGCFSIGALGVAIIKRIAIIGPFILVRFFNRGIGCALIRDSLQ